ncbi:MAG: serine protease [Planctomycetota bacterium]
MHARSIVMSLIAVLLALSSAHAQPGGWDPDIEKAVFKVRAGTDADRRIYSRALGFLVDDEGLGVTSFSTLQRARRAGEIVFEHAEESLDFEVLGVDSTSNLALVRVDLSPIPEYERPGPLRFRSERLSVGEQVHVLGDWRLTTGARRAVSGTMIETGRCADLPQNVRDATGCSPASIWMRTDAPTHVTHTGGPVLDDDGLVVGVSTWAWTGDDTQSFAIGAEEIETFIESFRNAAPLDLARERRGWSRLEVAQSTFPILEMDQRGSVSKALISARKLRSTVPCPKCDGKLVVTERQQIGTERGQGFSRPVYHHVEVSCGANGATGYNDVFRIVGKGKRVGPLERYIADLAMMDPFDEKAPDALVDSRDELDKMMMINPVAWTNRVVNPQAKRRVSTRVPEIGTPIIAVGLLTKGRDTLGGLTPLRTVKLIEYRIDPSQFMTKYNAMGLQLVGQRWYEEGLIAVIDEPELIVHNPIEVDAIPGEIVMVTGLLAGFVNDENGVRQPVIQDGFIVTPRPELAYDEDD